MRIDGGSGRSKKPAKKNKNNEKAAAILKDIGDVAVSKLGNPAPARRVKNFDKAIAKPRPKARVLENERAKGESKVKPRVIENERAKAAPKLKPRVIENERAKAEPKVDIQNLRTLLDKKQPENRRAKALTQLQRTGNKTYRLPDDSVLKSIATGKPVEKKPTKKPEKKERSLLDKASYLVPGIGPARVIAKGGGKALDAAVPLAGDLIAHTFGDKVRALNELASAEYKTGKKLGLISSSPTGSPMPSNAPQTSGFTGTEGVKRAAKKGTLAAGGLAIKGLSAPLAGTESVVGKGLVKAGVINGESAEKIRNAPGPIEAFKKTLKKGITPDQVHGSDITKGLGMGKTAGVFADLALDPLMVSGVGLAPVTGGASLAVAVARAENRLRLLAPQVFHGEEIQTALRSLRTDGDQAAFLTVVERVAPKEALDAARVELSQAAVKKALDARDARKEQMGVRKRRKLHEVVRGKDGKLVVEDVIPPPVGTDAVAAAMRAGKSRETSSTLGFQFRTPMGRKANINLKIAGKSIIREGNIPLLPLGKLPIYTSKKSYLRSVARERSAKLATIDGDAQAKLREVAVKKAEIQYLGRGTDDDMVKLDELETGIKQDAHLAKQKQGLLAGQEYTPDVPRSLFTSVADRVQARNVQIAQVDSGRVLAADVGRMTGRQFEQLYDKALSPIKTVKDPVLRSQSAQRAQLYREMMASSDGALQRTADDLLQLTPEEKLVANNLAVTNKMELAHAQDVGLMNHGWEGYAGQRIWYGANDALNPQQQIDKMVGRPIPSSGSTTAAMKQRSAQSLFDVADPDQIAGLLQSLGRVELDPSEYRVLADKLHESGTARKLNTRFVRYIQRGNTMNVDQLTDVEARSVTRDASFAPDAEMPLWRDLDDPGAEGQLLPMHFDQYGLELDPYAHLVNTDGGKQYYAKLRDAILDRKEAREDLLRDPTNPEALAWVQRYDDEIHRLDPAPRVDVFDPIATRNARELAQQDADAVLPTLGKLNQMLDEEERKIAEINAAMASEDAAPVGDTRGQGVQYHGAGAAIQPMPGYIDQSNLYGSWEMLYTTEWFKLANSYTEGKNAHRGNVRYRTDFMGRDFADDVAHYFDELKRLDDEVASLEGERWATSSMLVDDINAFVKQYGRQPSDTEHDAMSAKLSEVAKREADALQDRNTTINDYNDARTLLNAQRRDLTPSDPKLADLDNMTLDRDEWVRLADKHLGPDSQMHKRVLAAGRDSGDVRLEDLVREFSYLADPTAYKELVEVLWDEGYDAFTHIGGGRWGGGTADESHKVVIFFKAHQTLRMTPLNPGADTTDLLNLTSRLEDARHKRDELLRDANTVEIQSPRPRPNVDGFDTVVIDTYGGAWITGRNSRGVPPEIPYLINPDVHGGPGGVGPFDDVLARSRALQAEDPLEILMETLDNAKAEREDAMLNGGPAQMDKADAEYDLISPLGNLKDIPEMRTSLPDFRSGQEGYGGYKRDSGLVPELHPRVVGHVRSRATGIATANQIRYDAITQVVGRNSDEAKGTFVIKETGEEGPLRDLGNTLNENGGLGEYFLKGDPDRAFTPDEIEFPGPALLTNGDKAGEYWDAVTLQRYRHPHQTFGNTLMGQNIKESTLWPVQYIDDLAMSSQRAGEYDQVFDTALQSLNQRVLSTLRFGVTVPFPAYHIRNMASDLVKSLQADSGVLFHPWVNIKLGGAAFGKGLDRTVKVPGFGDMPLPDFLLMADMFGVRTGGQVNDFMEAFSTGAITEQKVAGLLKRTGGRMSELSAEREDVVRYMTFLQRMRRNGGDPAEAAWYMTRHHFNYNDLSHVERRTMRNIFLFYTWFRKNIPLQLIELGRRPGFFAGSFTVYRDLEAGDTPLNVGPFAGPAPFQPGLPDYVRDRMQSFSLPWKDTVVNIGWGAPWSDLGLLSTGDHGEDLFNTVSSMLTPPLSVALQIPTKQEPMTGRTYENDETSGQTAVIDNVMRLFGGEGLMRNEDDKPTLPWPVVVGLRNLPFLGRATASAGATSATRDSGRLQQYGSSLAGLTGLNLFVYPPKGGEREKKLIDSYLKGKVAERRDLLTAIDKLKDSEDSRARKAYVDRLAKLDKELLEDARKRGIGKQLKETDNAGYKSKKKRRKSKSPGGLSGGGLSGGGLSGGGLE